MFLLYELLCDLDPDGHKATLLQDTLAHDDALPH